MRDLIKHDALLWLVVFQQLWLVHSDPCCSFSDLLPRRSTVARLSCCCVFDRGHPRFWNFYSTIPDDVVRVKSYMNCLFDPARVVIRVMINKFYFVPEWLVSGVVGMPWNGGGLGTGESNVSIVLLNSVLHRSSSNMQSKRRDLHHIWPQWITTTFSTKLVYWCSRLDYGELCNASVLSSH